MRVIEVEAKEESNRWILWLVAGAAIGVTVGVLSSERFRGRRPDLKKLTRRLRSLAGVVGSQWGPMLDIALELKDQWDERSAARESVPETDELEYDEDLEEQLDDAFDDAEEEGDSPIGARVLEAFVNDPVLAARDVEIEADDDGAVLLHGTVRSAREVSHAVTLARGVPGVTKVQQRLSVRSRRPRAQ